MDEDSKRRSSELVGEIWNALWSVERLILELMPKIDDPRIEYELEHVTMNSYAARVCAECAGELMDGDTPPGVDYGTEELRRIAMKYANFNIDRNAWMEIHGH